MRETKIGLLLSLLLDLIDIIVVAFGFVRGVFVHVGMFEFYYTEWISFSISY